MSDKYTVDIGFKMTEDLNIGELNEKVERIAEKMFTSSGAGFGIRDVQFEDLDYAEALKIRNRLDKNFGDELEYISMYKEVPFDYTEFNEAWFE